MFRPRFPGVPRIPAIPARRTFGSGGAASQALTGLTFPSNGSASVRFALLGAACPDIAPITIFKKVNHTQQTGFYTDVFWGQSDGQVITGWAYWGMHPYPQGGSEGTVHNYEIAISGEDDIVDENANSTVVTKGVWRSQAGTAEIVNTDEIDVHFYYHLGDSFNRVIRHTTVVDDILSNLPPTPGLMFGDAAWSEGNELLSGIIRGGSVFTSVLTQAQIEALQVLETDADVLSYCTAQGITSLHYLNMNPTPDDISDKSGNGNHPTWQTVGRPTLWTP